MCSSHFVRKLVGSFLEYRLQKVVVIRSVKFGLFYRSIQVSVLVYFLFYIVWHKRGYQVKESPEGGVVFKVKGLDFVNRSGEDADYGARVWDSADYIVPPIMNGAIFITTNAKVTDKQAMTRCPDMSSSCSSDSDCGSGTFSANGRDTGRCNVTVGHCETIGWCPVSSADSVEPPGSSVLTRARNFTIFVKNSVDFRNLQKKRRNILDWMTADYLNTCVHQANHPNLSFCPVFRLGDILSGAGSNSDAIYRVGGTIGIDISWECNFDMSEERCLPVYHFRELDTGKGTEIEGFSVQYAYNYRIDQQPRRMLVRAFGIKIFVTVSGEGGKFSLYFLSMNLGSGLALFGLSSMLCDVILLRIAGQKQRSTLQQARVVYCDDVSCEGDGEGEGEEAERRREKRRARSRRRRRRDSKTHAQSCCRRGVLTLPVAMGTRTPPLEIVPLDCSPTLPRVVFPDPAKAETNLNFSAQQQQQRPPPSPIPSPFRPRIVRRCYANCHASPVARETLI